MNGAARRPFAILRDYRRDFAPVEEIPFIRNYRSTRMVLGACEGFVLRTPNSVTKRIQPQVAEKGEPVYYFEAANPAQEAEWIAGEIRRLKAAHQLSYRDFVVLTRTNFTARDISEQFTRLSLPHLKVDEYKFFARSEIKTALAHLRLLLNPHDGNSLARFLQTPPKGIGPATLEELRGEPKKAGLRAAICFRWRCSQPAIHSRLWNRTWRAARWWCSTSNPPVSTPLPTKSSRSSPPGAMGTASRRRFTGTCGRRGQWANRRRFTGFPTSFWRPTAVSPPWCFGSSSNFRGIPFSPGTTSGPSIWSCCARNASGWDWSFPSRRPATIRSTWRAAICG